jgi:hypothetical protein
MSIAAGRGPTVSGAIAASDHLDGVVACPPSHALREPTITRIG